jgi:hypothetical protein
MTKKTSFGPTDYARDVTENTLGYVRELQDELSCLRTALGTAELEYQRVLAENDGLRRTLREQLDHRAKMEAMLDTVSRERTEMSARYQAVALETASLASLYVTSYRLHESLARDELLTVLQEAIISLLGSEAYVVFDVSREGALETAASMGLAEEQVASVQRRPPLIQRCLDSCEIYVQGTDGEGTERADGELAAVVPLCRDGVSEGLVVVFSLLPHKPGFTPSDRELLNLLSAHVATALYRADLHARAVAAS